LLLLMMLARRIELYLHFLSIVKVHQQKMTEFCFELI